MWVDVNFFRVDVNFQTAVVVHSGTYFFILISINIKVLLKFHPKFQPKIPSHSGENGNFNSFAIFSNGGHLEFSTKFYNSEALESDHAAYEI